MRGFEHLSSLFGGAGKKNERPKSYRAQNFRRRQEYGPAPEVAERRKTRFEHHLAVIQKLLNELSKESTLFSGTREKEDERLFRFDKKDLQIGLSAAAQVLGGGTVAALAMNVIRGNQYGGPALSSMTAFLGARILSDGLLRFHDYFLRESNEAELSHLRRARGLQEGDEGMMRPEKITERTLRAQMVSCQEDTRFERMYRERSEAYEKTKTEVPLEILAGGEAAYLKEIGDYMDEIIGKQRILLETMKDYMLLSGLHHGERLQKSLGTSTALSMLEGGLAVTQLVPKENIVALVRDAFTTQATGLGARFMRAIGPEAWAALSAAAAGTFTALIAGTKMQFDSVDSFRKEQRRVKSIFQRIEKKIHALERERSAARRRYAALTGESAEIVRQASAVSWNDAIGQVIGRELSRAQEVEHIRETIPASEPSFRFDPFSPGMTIEELLGMIPEEQQEPLAESEAETPEAGVEQSGGSRFGSDYSPPLSFDQLELQSRVTFKPFMLGLLRKNARGDKEAPIADLTNVSSVDDVIRIEGSGSSLDVYDSQSSERLPSEGIDRLLRCLKEHRQTINRHYNPNDPRTINKFFGLDFTKDLEKQIELLEAVRRNRDIEEGRAFIVAHSGADLRAWLIREFHIASLSEEEANQLGQLEFESLLAHWYAKETTRNADREALERVLTRFNIALDSLEEEQQPIPDYAGIVEVIRGATQRLKRPRTIVIPEQEALRSVALREVRTYYTREYARLFPHGGTRDELLSRRERTAQRPFIIPSNTLAGYGRTEISQIQYTKEGVANQRIDLGPMAVDPQLIIGSALPREGLILPDSQDDIIIRAERLVRWPTQQTFGEFFFESQRGNKERISLWQFSIPAQHGESDRAIYLVDETGADAVAAAEVAGLPYIIAHVHEVRLGSAYEPFVFRLSDSREDAPRFHFLRELRRLRLIEGEIPDEIDFNGAGKKIVIKIIKQVLPWTIWFFPSLPRVTNACINAYPKLLHGLTDVDGDPLSPSAIELLTNESKFYERFIAFPLKLQAQQGGSAG